MVKERELTRVQELTYELRVSDVMKTDLITITPKTTIWELREILRLNRISGTPVVEGDKLVGIISIEDFIKCLAEGEMDVPVEKRMIRDVETIYADEPLIQVVSKFDKFGFGRFPVLERGSEKLSGILTKSDIIQGLLKKLEIDYHEEEIHRYRASHIFEDIIADEVVMNFQYKVAGRDFAQAGYSASRLKKTLTRLGFKPQILRRVAIATYEAEMNIVIFTEGGEISAEVSSRKITIDVQDTGPGIPDVKQAMKPGFSTAPLRIQELGFGAGMGLPNIKKCADVMKINSRVGEGTRLKIIINIDGESKK